MGYGLPFALTALLMLSPAVQARERITDGTGRTLGYSEKTERGTKHTDGLGRPVARCDERSCRDAMNRTILRSRDRKPDPDLGSDFLRRR